MSKKRRGDRSTSSNRKQKARGIGKTNNTSDDEFNIASERDLSGKVLSRLSRCVVALASFSANKMHSACTGTVLKDNKSVLSILTSANLIRASDGANKIASGLMIEVLLPTFEYASGWLDHYDFPGVQQARIDRRLLQIGPHCKVVAAGRQYDSGKFMTNAGITADETNRLSPEELMISTCKITMSCVGGPFFDFDGKFVGMNFCANEKTPFLPWNIIYKLLVHDATLWLPPLSRTQLLLHHALIGSDQRIGPHQRAPAVLQGTVQQMG